MGDKNNRAVLLDFVIDLVAELTWEPEEVELSLAFKLGHEFLCTFVRLPALGFLSLWQSHQC